MVERLLAAKRWARARSAIEDELVADSGSHWLRTMLGLTWYEEQEYAKALEETLRALAIKPDCALTLFHYAGCLAMVGRVAEAIGVYQQLLGRDVEDVAYGVCGEGMDWALQLLNDSNYRLGRCQQFLGDRKEAQLALLKYLHNLSHGVGTIYSAKKAEAALNELDGTDSSRRQSLLR